ncbi:MAG TPA: hypothetical protein VGE38_04855, partial [Nocardioides sp.]|uniref:hypothetical protein n=1 Tax=Nocardioides sp. TaxID=35761 RepID=UPI002ED9891C
LQIAFSRYNVGVERARREYAEHPSSGVIWCPGCVHPAGSTRDCANCKSTRYQRKRRALVRKGAA